jgi:hypothetical protein
VPYQAAWKAEASRLLHVEGTPTDSGLAAMLALDDAGPYVDSLRTVVDFVAIFVLVALFYTVWAWVVGRLVRLEDGVSVYGLSAFQGWIVGRRVQSGLPA